MTKGRCIHCKHIGADVKCDKGHDISAIVKAATPPGEDWKRGSRLRAPCDSKEWDIELFTRGGNKLSDEQLRIIESKPTCPDFTNPTDEQVAEHERMIDAWVEETKKLTPVIREFKLANKTKLGWNQNTTTVTCPICGSKLHMRISSFNGHVWGQCEKLGCASWME